MKILVLSYPMDVHFKHVEPKLKERGIEPFLFAGRELPFHADMSFVSSDKDSRVILSNPRGKLDCSEVHSVWNRRCFGPNLNEIKDSHQRRYMTCETRALYYSLYNLTRDKFWLSSPDAIEVADRKSYQILLARELGFKVPDTYMGNSPEELKQFISIQRQKQSLLALKPVDGMGYMAKPGSIGEWATIIHELLNPVSQKLKSPDYPNQMFYQGELDYTPYRMYKTIFTNKLTPDLLESRLAQIQNCPVIIQEYIEKAFELRVTVVGNKIFPAAIYTQDTDSERDKEDYRHYESRIKYVPYDLPAHIEEKCFEMIRRLGLQFGCMDFIVTPKGEHIFLENNPNGQWLWIEAATKLPIGDAIADLLADPETHQLKNTPSSTTCQFDPVRLNPNIGLAAV